MKPNLKHSQNFLKSSRLVESLIEQSSIGRDDVVYEIGPGTGIITAALASRCKQVIAVEADPTLYEELRARFREVTNVKLIHGDVLTQPLPTGRYKVFSNIPFTITADIIHKLTGANRSPQDSYLMIQREAAKKIIGQPYATSETLLSLSLKPFFEPNVMHQFRRDDFKPTPAVEVVLLHLQRRKAALVDDAAQWQDFIAYGFSSNKPTLKKGLGKILTHNQFKRLAKEFGFGLQVTPSELSFEQWRGLYDYYLVGVIDDKKRLVQGSNEELGRKQARLEKIHRTRL